MYFNNPTIKNFNRIQKINLLVKFYVISHDVFSINFYRKIFVEKTIEYNYIQLITPKLYLYAHYFNRPIDQNKMIEDIF